jgi:hypothetical protein
MHTTKVEDMAGECSGYIQVEGQSGRSVSLTLYLPGIDKVGAART